MGAVSVRGASKSDVPLLLDMMEDFNAFEKIPWTREAGEAPLRKLLADPRIGVVGIIEDGAEVVGYFVLAWGFDLEWGGRDAFLTELFLVERARGRGLGKSALERAEAFAERHGALAMHLLVRHENGPARRLYERAGFVVPPRAFMTKKLGARR
jgi:ribosomal protein S18 acetylase RimI-like enzyme